MSSHSHPASRKARAHGARPSPQSQAGRALRREAQRRGVVRRYRGLILGGVAIVAVIAVVAMVALSGGGSGSATSARAAPASADLVSQVTSVPASTYDSVGLGSASKTLQAIKAPALTADGKPLVLYTGGEFCPYCAAERWAMVMALSRFGTFDGLKTATSSGSDVFPNTATFSFDGTTYKSDYLAFQGVEMFSNQRSGSGYARLQPLTDAQQQVVAQYNPQGGIPFVDFAGKYTLSGATFNPGVLSGLDQQGIASKLGQTSSSQAQAIVGSANLLTAAICQVTNGQPGDVCQSPGVAAAAAGLPK